jgi:signal peptidase I
MAILFFLFRWEKQRFYVILIKLKNPSSGEETKIQKRMGSIDLKRVAVIKKIRHFFFPSFTLKFLIRVAAVAVSAYLFFGHLFTPLLIKGHSMEPTYRDGSFNLYWKWRYLFSKPKRHEVVAIRLAGSKVMLLKRVVALEGERVEFRHGKLFVNEREIGEPYVRYPCDWDLPPRQVEKDCVYVVGDNRNMPIENHLFGQAPLKRINGTPLW